MTFYKASAKVANMKKPILSIEEELAACRKAFQENPKAKYAWCCHHSILLELLTEPCENRIQYILENKEKKEQAIRFRNFRPLRIELPKEIIKAIAKLNEARAKYNEACAKLNEAEAKLNKARAKYNEARAKLNEAEAKLNKARAKYNEAFAKYDKALAKRNEARAKYNEACAKYDEAIAKYDKALATWNKGNVMFLSDWPDNTWNGKNIF